MVDRVHERVEALLRARGLVDDEGGVADGDDDEDGQHLLLAASVAGREALGLRAGAVPRWMRQHPVRRIPDRCAAAAYFHLHAAVRIAPHDREALERLCRYVQRPPLSLDRRTRQADGTQFLKFERGCRHRAHAAPAARATRRHPAAAQTKPHPLPRRLRPRGPRTRRHRPQTQGQAGTPAHAAPSQSQGSPAPPPSLDSLGRTLVPGVGSGRAGLSPLRRPPACPRGDPGPLGDAAAAGVPRAPLGDAAAVERTGSTGRRVRWPGAHGVLRGEGCPRVASTTGAGRSPTNQHRGSHGRA